jgi:3-oxoacyl-[acyl-carrier-protein] synthase II
MRDGALKKSSLGGSVDFDSHSRLRAAPRLAELEEVVVTGIGVVLPNCERREDLWQHLREGQSQLQIEPDPADCVPSAIGRVRAFDFEKYLPNVPKRVYRGWHREQRFYVASVVQALADAHFDLSAVDSRRVGLFDGTSRGNFAHWYELMTEKLRDGARFSVRDLSSGMPGQAVGLAAAVLQTQGPTYTFNGTCASGVIAIGNAFRELQAGRIDAAVGTGHDAALVAPLFQMYRDGNLLSREAERPERAIRPYAGSCANAFGEGAVSMVLETRKHAEGRGASILAEIVGFRHGNGGEHPTDVDFTGERPAALMADTLAEANLTAAQVDFVLGHGNGVPASDISELNYMRRVFGRRTQDVPLISTKPIYGHTLGASSALNVAAAALMLEHGYVIPTIGLDESRVVHGFNHQANLGVERSLRSGLVVAYGIGGQNAVLVLRKADA